MATQLELDLGLEDKAMSQQFKKAIVGILDETFDLGLLFDSQPRRVLNEFEKKLIDQFPQILLTKSERKKKKNMVYRYARKRFSHKRSLTKQFRVDGSITGGTANEYRHRLGNQGFRKLYQKSKQSSPRDAPPSPSNTTNTILATPPMRQVKSEPSTMPNIMPSTESSSPSPPVLQTTLVEPNPPNLLGTPPETLQPRVEEVANFLRTCIPDMSYFLPAFIKFGCRSRGFLLALASYSDERIDDALRKIVGKVPHEVVVTEMDIWVLKEGLKKFMLTTSSMKKRQSTK